MKTSPLISVIVPLYNTEKYIAECIKSIISQTYTNLDILVINDASTDNGRTIVCQFQEQDSRIRIIDLKENGGITNARNTGLDNANGEFIAWCDSDDIYHHSFINTMYDILCKTEADFVECQCVSGQDFNPQLFDNIKIDNIEYAIGEKDDFLKRFASHQLQTSLWSKLFKKEVFSDFRFPSNRLYEENLFYFHYYPVLKKAAYITAPLYFYRSRAGSIMKTLRERELQQELQLSCDFLRFADSLPGRYKNAFRAKTLKLLLNIWQRSVTADIPIVKKCRWRKKISDIINTIGPYYTSEFISNKEWTLLKIHNSTITYLAYMLYNKLK